MKIINNLLLPVIVGMSMIMTGCDKTKPYDTEIPPPLAHFAGKASQLYLISEDPAPTYYIVAATTDVADVDREITFTITSPTGATPGTHYTLNNTTGKFLIKAGKATDTLAIQAVYAPYGAGRVDTLVFDLARPSMEVAGFQNKITLVMRDCSEATANPSELLGEYANTFESYGGGAPYGPYSTFVTSAVQTSPTTIRIGVENIWDTGWGPIEFDLDYSNPGSRTATVVNNPTITPSDAGDLNASYAGLGVAVRVPSTTLSPTPGTYSYCDQTANLKLQLGVSDGGTVLGYFGGLVVVNMAR